MFADTENLPVDMNGSPSQNYALHISRDLHAPEWDAFLASTPGGDHTQTGMWAQLKSRYGWDAVRVVATDQGRILGGAQLLMRRIRPFGRIGYVTRAPILAAADPALAQALVSELLRIGREQRIAYLAIQPPDNNRELTGHLAERGFQTGLVDLAPTATCIIDLAGSLDDILSRMHKKTRQNVRRSLRRGITVREGSQEDLLAFHRLLQSTSLRRGFTSYEKEYFHDMWQAFTPHDGMKLFLAEMDGELVSAYLVVAFGETVIPKRSAWSGSHARLKPNEAAQWAAIKWAKEQGFRYYDLGGFDDETARAIRAGELDAEALTQSVASFKLGFGGELKVLPEPQAYIRSPLLRPVYRAAAPLMSRWPIVDKALNRLRAS